MDAHILDDAFGIGELGDPEGPEDVAAGSGDAVEGGTLFAISLAGFLLLLVLKGPLILLA